MLFGGYGHFIWEVWYFNLGGMAAVLGGYGSVIWGLW